MELHQPITDSNTGFADTPERNLHGSVEFLSDSHRQCDDFGNPSKRARTLGSDSRSHHAEEFSGELDQRDESTAANHGILDSLNYDMSIDDGGLPEYPVSGWAFEDNFDNSPFLFGQPLANNTAGFNPIAERLAGDTSEIFDLTLPNAEEFNEATPCSNPTQSSDKDGVFTSTHNSPDTPLSTPDGGISESKQMFDEKHSETIHDTCFGYASLTHPSCLIFTLILI